MSSLCNHCSQIPFYYLSCPTASDIRKARHAAKTESNIVREYAGKKLPKRRPLKTIHLGTLSRIHKNKELCGLCGLIYHVIQQRGAPPGVDETHFMNCDHIHWFVKFSIYSWISESNSDSITGRDLEIHRLDLGAMGWSDGGKDSGYITACNDRICVEEVLVFYVNIVQACHIDEFMQGLRSPETGVDDQRMLFSGRQRPETVDLHLLRSWITICKTAHGISCCFNEHPSEMSQPQHCDK